MDRTLKFVIRTGERPMALEMRSDRLRFRDWEIFPEQRKLIIQGANAAVGSRAFDVLLALANQPGRTIGRSQLLDVCWPGLVVEENNLSVQIATLRKVLGAATITTVPGIGYCLSAVPYGEDFQIRAEATASPAPSARSSSDELAGSGNLPAELPALIGREAEVADLLKKVQGSRVVSVLGPGGIGKTSLAQAAAFELRDSFKDGVWIVELAPLSDASLVPAAVANALGIVLPGKKRPLVEVIEAVKELSTLIVLDNCEHVVGAASSFAQAVLRGGRHIRILATSQASLGLSEERAIRIGPLSLPEAHDIDAANASGAVALLVQRIQGHLPSFALTAENVADTIEICRSLDGLPLAIELAAARVPLLGLSGVRRLLGERFRVLTVGTRDSLPKQRTLLATMEWSHGLLTRDEQIVFRRCGAFAGTFGLAQAHRVLGGDTLDQWSVLEALGALIDKSLVVVDQPDPPRYRLLDSSRAFARDHLRQVHEEDATLRRHAEGVLEIFDQSVSNRWELPSQDLLRTYLPDLDNCRAALEWAAPVDDVLYIGLVGASAWIFAAVGQTKDGLDHCHQALQRIGPTTLPALEARLQHSFCTLSHYSEGTAKLVAAERAVTLYRMLDDPRLLYSALGRLAITATVSGDCKGGRQAIEQMESLADPDWPALARWELLNAKDYLANQEGAQDEAGSLAHKQLFLAEAVGDTAKLFFSLMALEQCAAARGDWTEAVERGRGLIARARRERFVEKMNVYIANLATALIMTDQLDEAQIVAREAAAADRKTGTLWQSLELFAMLAFKQGRHEDAAVALGRSEKKNKWRAAGREPVERLVRDQLMAALEDAIAPSVLRDLLMEGANLDDEGAAKRALAD
ncbi:MAG: winged helix-turn-helix domain-containing protein [Paucibacter sp.]|nr:winged helix-turn-helix domain-containing protein [Roseateles sp.]